jgi:uncharacterized Zn finger protein (UPF0148 family)
MGQYKEKTCPTCDTKHRKQGKFCSRSCGNHRTYTAEQKQQKSEAQTRHLNGQSDTAEYQRWIMKEVGERRRQSYKDPSVLEKTLDDYNVIPGRPLPSDQFVDGGDLWTEVNE